MNGNKREVSALTSLKLPDSGCSAPAFVETRCTLLACGALQLFGCVAALSVLPAGAAAEPNLATQVQSAREAFANLKGLGLPESQRRRVVSDPVSRLTSGKLLLRLGDPWRASAVFLDVLSRPAPPNVEAEALFNLGVALQMLGDHVGAKDNFSAILDRQGLPAFTRLAPRAAARIAQISVVTGRFDGIERVETVLRAASEARSPSADVSFALARLVLYRAWLAGVPQAPRETLSPEEARALQLFSAVPDSADEAAWARYYEGLLLALQGKFSDAIAAFNRVQALSAATVNQADRAPAERLRLLVDQARLAVGRSALERGALAISAEALESVGRDSSLRPRALFELAWVYARQGDFIQADRAARLLITLYRNHELANEMRLLRARLMLKRGYFLVAEREYSTAQSHLERDLLQLTAAEAYVSNASAEEDESIEVFIAGALARSRSAAPVLRLARDIAASRDALESILDTAALVERALAQPAASRALPAHRARLGEVVAIEGRLGWALASALGEADDATRVVLAPDEATAAVQRQAYARELVRLNTVLSAQEAQLFSLKSQSSAVKQLARRMESTGGASASDVSGLIQAGDGIAATTDQLRDELKAIRVELSARRGWGVLAGPVAHKREAALKRLVARAAGEGQANAAVGEAAELLSSIGAYRDELERSALNEAQAILAELAAHRQAAATFARRIDQQSADVDSVRRDTARLELAKQKRDAADLGKQAALGRGDVAWARRTVLRERLDRQVAARATELRLLDDHFREALAEANDSGDGTAE